MSIRSILAVAEDPADLQLWTRLASRIEGYREEWGVEPDDVRTPPVDDLQHRAWQATSIPALESLRRVEIEPPAHTLERGLGVEL